MRAEASSRRGRVTRECRWGFGGIAPECTHSGASRCQTGTGACGERGVPAEPDGLAPKQLKRGDETCEGRRSCPEGVETKCRGCEEVRTGAGSRHLPGVCDRWCSDRIKRSGVRGGFGRGKATRRQLRCREPLADRRCFFNGRLLAFYGLTCWRVFVQAKKLAVARDLLCLSAVNLCFTCVGGGFS